MEISRQFNIIRPNIEKENCWHVFAFTWLDLLFVVGARRQNKMAIKQCRAKLD